MRNRKQMAAVLLAAILGITANTWFVQVDSSMTGVRLPQGRTLP